MHAVRSHRLLLGWRGIAEYRAQTGGRFEQLGGLVPDHAQVIFLIHIRVAAVEQLQHLAFRNGIGRVGQDAHDAHVVHLHHHLEGAGIEEVAHQHAGRIPEQRIGGRLASPQFRRIHHVVVQQGCGMDEFDDSRQVVMKFSGIAKCARGKDDQCRAQAFSAAIDDVFADLPNKPHIGIKLFADDRVHRAHILGDKASDTLD